MAESENRLEETYVLDTSALLYASLPSKRNLRYFTIREVIDEIYKDELKREVVNALIESQKVKIQDPKPMFIEKARQIAKEHGELLKMSETDIKLLALAIQLHEDRDITVMTDDYSIQNLLEILKIKYIPIRRKIRKVVKKWIFKCMRCGEVYDDYIEECSKCGGKVIRSRG